jgi:hypothetical protein
MLEWEQIVFKICLLCVGGSFSHLLIIQKKTFILIWTFLYILCKKNQDINLKSDSLQMPKPLFFDT